MKFSCKAKAAKRAETSNLCQISGINYPITVPVQDLEHALQNSVAMEGPQTG